MAPLACSTLIRSLLHSGSQTHRTHSLETQRQVLEPMGFGECIAIYVLLYSQAMLHMICINILCVHL